jgi:hypothetical protein
VSTLDFALAREKSALERQLDLAASLVHCGANDKETIGRSQAQFARRVAAANHDGRRCLLNDLEVVGDTSALVVGARGELVVCPELVGGFIASVFVLEVLSLNREAWTLLCEIFCSKSRTGCCIQRGAEVHAVRQVGMRLSYEPRPDQTPRQNSSARSPSLARSSGRTLLRGIRLMQMSWVAGLRFGLRVL